MDEVKFMGVLDKIMNKDELTTEDVTYLFANIPEVLRLNAEKFREFANSSDDLGRKALAFKAVSMSDVLRDIYSESYKAMLEADAEGMAKPFSRLNAEFLEEYAEVSMAINMLMSMNE